MAIATIAYCIVGCNAGAPDCESLHVLECDTETGKAKIVQTVRGVQGTTYFQLGGDRKTMYTYIGEERDGRKVGSLVKFALDGHVIGAMTRLAELPCGTPCHIALSPDEKTVSFAAYLSGMYGTLDAGGTLRTAVLPDDAIGPRTDRQKKAYAHQTFYTPDGRLMGVCDLGCDRVNIYDFKSPDGLRSPLLSIRADPGDGPRHAIFSKDGKFLFVLNELSSTVTSYSFDSAAFKRVGKWSMTPEGTPYSDTKAAAIKLTADGKVLMASNRGHDSIALFDVGQDGALTLRNIAKLRGSFPRDFELMPGEKFMVVGHKMSNEIQIYAFDRAICSLSPVGDAIPCWRPLCFKFL